MTGLAHAHEVAIIPEQRGTAAVPDLVMGHELRGIVVEPAAAWPLAGEQIAQQHGPAQQMPTLEPVPRAPRFGGAAIAFALL